MTDFYEEEIVIRDEDYNENNDTDFITDVNNIDASFDEALLFF